MKSVLFPKAVAISARMDIRCSYVRPYLPWIKKFTMFPGYRLAIMDQGTSLVVITIAQTKKSLLCSWNFEPATGI